MWKNDNFCYHRTTFLTLMTFVAWLTERPEKVNCKGKGMMQTFWFEPKAQKRAARRMSVGSAFHEFTGAKLSEGTTLRAVEVKIDRDVMLQPETRTQSLPSGDLIKRSDSIIWGSGDKCSVSEITNPCQKDFESNITGRLIEWNCNVLLRLLKKVVAYRDSDSSLQKGAPGSSLKLMSSNDVAFLAANTCNISAIIPEEVRDMISFRSFHPHERSSIEMDSIDLGDKVDRQIKAFVKSIASLYRSNPFHNYEHVSIHRWKKTFWHIFLITYFLSFHRRVTSNCQQ